MAQLLGYIFGGLVLLSAGVGIGYWLAHKVRDGGKAEAIQAEFDEYRRQVGGHFEQTAQHFRTIGLEYRALYDHMASGAEALCETRATDDRLSFDPRPGPTPPGVAANVDDPSSSQVASPAAESTTIPAVEDSTAGSPGEDDSTPETRAREAGGESAPAEEPEEALEEILEETAEESTAPEDAASGESEDASPEVSADTDKGSQDSPPKEGAADDNDRIYH